MKSLVVYSSRTGNTKKVAQAVFDVMPEPKEIHSVRDNPSPDAFDFIAMGFWIDKGKMDTDARAYVKTLKNKDVGLFGTLGAYPDSDHARECSERALALMTDNQVHGLFLCQGKVDPALVKAMAEMSKDDPDHPHAMTPERKARLAEAAKHPDDVDFKNAGKAMLEMLAKMTSRRSGGSEAICGK